MSTSKPGHINLTQEERSLLERVAGTVPLGSWIRASLGHITARPDLIRGERTAVPPEKSPTGIVAFRVPVEVRRRIDQLRGTIPRRAWIRDALVRYAEHEMAA